MLTFLANAPLPTQDTLDNVSTALQITVDIGIALIVLSMFLCILRLLISKHLADRALAVDTLGVELIGLVILLGMRFETGVFIDGILVLSLLSFAGTVAMAQYIGRPHFRKPPPQPDDLETEHV